MSDVQIEELQKGDKVLWARVLPKDGSYDIYELIIRTVEPTWCVGTDKHHRAYIFGLHQKCLFKDRKKALEYLKEMKLYYKDVKIAEE